MFKMVKGDYFWPIDISLPDDDGVHRKSSAMLKFKRVPQSEFDKLISDIEDGKVQSIETGKKLITGWKDFQDEDGNELPFSDKALLDFLEIPGVALTILKGYNESIKGAKVKN